MNYYICCPTKTGFYSAVFAAYRDKDAFITSADVQPAFGDTVTRVADDEAHAERVRRGLFKYGGTNALSGVAYVLRSGTADKENIAYGYVKLTFEQERDVSRYYSHPAVAKFNETLNRVTHERHRFTGFLRFTETASGVMYAYYAPDNDVTDLLAPFFKARMGNTPFIIHDVKRNKFALWSGNEMKYIETETPLNIVLSDREETLQALWKQYFKSVTIKERPHKKQQDGYLPRRYRKYMTEFD